MVYKLDVSREEYRDDYAKEQEAGELWQIYARNQLVSSLSSILKDAEKYKLTRLEGDSDETWLSHNAILVTSPRGSGKTVFLRNSKYMWNSSQQGKEESGKLFFLNVIDPTMLMDNDSFANVIIAQIYQAVSEHFNKKVNVCSKDRDKFHHSLKRLSDSMGKSSEFDGSIGIDKILKYSSGIQVENKFHNFVESAIKVLGCSAIVVLIDDVDMALENAFEVVDEVRRYLGCPYIIPIVSGDLKLYEHMTQVRFDERAYSNYCRDVNLRKDGIQLSSDLTTAYLTKVFPSHTRITLFSIENLLSQMEIIESDTGNKDSSSKIIYADYRERLFNKFNYLCHNRDSRKEQFTPKSARELTQLVRTIKPSELINLEQNDAEAMNLYIKYKGWAAQQKQGDAFSHAESFVSIAHNEDHEFDIQQLLAFNIKEQSDLVMYPWAKYKVYESQLEALSILPDFGGKEVKNKQLLDSFFNAQSRVLKPMPPLEFLVHNLFIRKDVNKEGADLTVLIDDDDFPKYFDKEKYRNRDSNIEIKYRVRSALLNIYTEGELYSTLNNEKRFVLFSRAFELLFYSFLNFGGKVSYDDVDKIMRKKPFYSIINLAETKISIEGDEYESYSEVNDISTDDDSSLAVYGNILKWNSKHKDSLGSLQPVSLIPIFSYVFNSVFTAMNVIKRNYASGSKAYESEYLSDMILRFRYNILNSILRSGIYGEAIYANVLVGAMSETIRDSSKLASADRTYTRNRRIIAQEIIKFKNVDKEKARKLESILSLHDAIEDHPIFAISDQYLDADAKPLLRLGSKTLSINSDAKSKNKKQKLATTIKPDVNSLKSLLDDGITSMSFLLNSIMKGNINKEETMKVRLAENLLTPGVNDAVNMIQSRLQHDFQSSASFNSLSTKQQNLLKAIFNLDNNNAAD